MKLNFEPLPKAPWINNAVVPINEHFRLSVSYNTSRGLWYAGSYGAFEAAIQVGNPASPTGSEYWSLVELPDNPRANIYPDCGMDDLERLCEIAKDLEYACELQVLENARGEPEEWLHRFFCAKGHDEKAKTNYVRSVFPKWRGIRAGLITSVA